MSTKPYFELDPITAIASGISVKKQMVKSLNQFTCDVLGAVKWTDFDQSKSDVFSQLIEHSFDLMQQRKPGQSKLMVYTPSREVCEKSSHGSFSVIEMLNDDVPFLLDSLLAELQARNLKIHLVLHPVLTVRRDHKGKLLEVAGAMAQGRDGVTTESFISLHVEELTDDMQDELRDILLNLMDRVQMVVHDWLPMRNRLTNAATCLSTEMPRVPVDRLSESIQFLRWALDNNFTFLGMREYELQGSGAKSKLAPKKGTGLGILRDPHVKVLRRGTELTHMTPEVRKFFFSSDPIIITKANIKSDIHRRTYMDYIGVKLYNDDGDLAGELRIVGLFTSSAYASRVATIPVLRQKLDYVLDNSGSSRDSHTGKALTNVVETFPRDELFQISNKQLYAYAKEIEALDHSPKVRVLRRVDEFDRFVSVMVFVPRDQFSTDNRKLIGDYLAKAYHGRVSAHYPYFAESPYVRIHFIIGRDKGKTPKLLTQTLEAEIEDICRRWEDRVSDVVGAVFDRDEQALLTEQYGSAFPVGYQEIYGTSRLLEDIMIIEEMDENRCTAVAFHDDREGQKDCVEVTLYNLGEPIPLSKRVPIFENLGFSVIHERSYSVVPNKGQGQQEIYQHMMMLRTHNGQAVDLQKLNEPLVEGFMAVWNQEAADDRFNELISLLGIQWREAALMRGLGHYLRQINVPYEQDYLAHVLVRYSAITKTLIDLFHARFDPGQQKGAAAKVKRLNKKLEQDLAEIPSLDEDQILRSFQNLIMVALRTNFYQRDENDHAPESITFKFDSQNVEGAPEPRPFREIFVYSPKVEGVHLRFGKIARGGLRWSDRHQDFRTEVLGLVKAQLVKNTVIVPTGSKGGFVPKDMPENPSREEFMACGIAAYKRFINALLSVTDNLQGKKVIPPQNTVRYDDDDPYLVVAADKGTASFSDIANEISCERGFWLGDAFASGGSQGYDHKVMGITARGGWEAVKRHFREMDINIQRQPFSAIGVGDMSGDVFGNGMLLSKATKLLAAFDHRDIFIDPDPDPKKSWVERKRLFDMGRSSWGDYNKKLISKGGGIFSRSAKSIKLTPEIRKMLGVKQGEMSPTQLMKSILKMEADLLWFGGIGTYVKGAVESNGDVGDRANDSIRVSAQDLNVKVIGEGANLGITQAGRMEFADKGGRVNTDAIDNSAGVNSSDLEVNIKIALGQAVQAGRLTMAKRNKVLASMTEDVAKRCLVNNYRQTLTLSLGEYRGLSDLSFQQRLMRSLEDQGLLNRGIEGLPDESELAERQEAGQALSRPELATLLGFAKIDLFNQLINEPIVDDVYYAADLKDYFPEGMQKEFAKDIRSHPLKREIIATQLTNDIINRGGSTMFVRLSEETGHSCGDLAGAFTLASCVLGLNQIYEAVDGLDNKIKGAVQLALYAKLQFITRRRTAWFMVNGDFSAGLNTEIKVYKSGLAAYMKAAKRSLSSDRQEVMAHDFDKMVSQGVPEDLARSLSELPLLCDGLDVVLASKQANEEVGKLATIDQVVEDTLKLGALTQATEHVPEQDVYDRWALNAVVSRIQSARRLLATRIGAHGDGFDAWALDHEVILNRTQSAIGEILSGGDVGLSKLIVAVGQLDELAR